MAKESAYYTVSNLTGKKDTKNLKKGLDTLPGVLSVSVSESRVAVDYDSTGTGSEQLMSKFQELGYDAQLDRNENHRM